jgi:hypothetical protein
MLDLSHESRPWHSQLRPGPGPAPAAGSACAGRRAPGPGHSDRGLGASESSNPILSLSAGPPGLLSHAAPGTGSHLEGWVMLCNMLYNRGGVISHILLYNMLYGGVT